MTEEPRLTRALPGAGAAAPSLRCPVCAGGLTLTALRTLGCAKGHRFEAARQGYFNLLTGRGTPFVEDPREMVDARERVLAAGTYAELSSTLASLAAQHLTAHPPGDGGCAAQRDLPARGPLVLDCGVGTGHYLAAVLAALPDGAHGIGMDLSRQALRRAAKVPEAVALAWDLYRPWPVREGVADVLLDVFAPRNVAEAARALRPGGLALVVTPLEGHLEALTPLGLLGTHPGKAERVADAFLGTGGFEALETLELRETRQVSPALAADLVLMGPAGHHLEGAGVHARAEALVGAAAGAAGPDLQCAGMPTLAVTLAFRIQRFVRRP